MSVGSIDGQSGLHAQSRLIMMQSVHRFMFKDGFVLWAFEGHK